MGFRNTTSILSDGSPSAASLEADVIMTAMVAGFTASALKQGQPIEFVIDPRDKEADFDKFLKVIEKLNGAVLGYLEAEGIPTPPAATGGLAPRYDRGAVIVGVYAIGGQAPPHSSYEPELSAKGKKLYEQIVAEQVPQYVGRGAYTGFVDHKNTEGNTDPVGPRSTARFLVPQGGLSGSSLPRWLPGPASTLWESRLRLRTTDSYVPWGVIGGNDAGKAIDAEELNPTDAANRADQITGVMRETLGMVFEGEPTATDIAGYTHGMIQAIYKAYALGPSCTPYEIPVGKSTTKLASCFPCSLFMVALGYPPTASHLGRGESWIPLYEPYNLNGPTEPNEPGVVRDLNNSWSASCDEWLMLGVAVLKTAHVASEHRSALADLDQFLAKHREDRNVASTLVLDALTVHDSESTRVDRTLRSSS